MPLKATSFTAHGVISARERPAGSAGPRSGPRRPSRVLPRITWGGGVDWTTGAAFAGMGTLGVGEGLTQGGSELGATLLP